MPLLPEPLDTSALTAQPDRSASRTLVSRARRSFPGEFYPGTSGRSSAAAFGLLFASLGVLVAIFAWVSEVSPLVVTAILVILLVVIPAIGIASVAIARRRLTGTWIRLDGFARANGLQFAPHISAGRWRRSGTKFAVSPGRVDALNVISSPGARNLMIGTLRVDTQSGKSGSVTMTDFVTLSLARHLPHIVLDAKSNNGLGWNGRLGAEFDRHQRLELEGNFNDTFTLYCPAGYEADALYLFTPDIMLRMQNHAADWDIEIIDDELYLYSPRRVLGHDAENWQAVATTINALGEKIAQWERWRESRGDESVMRQLLPDRSFVADEGRRLKARFPWWMWIVLPVGIALAVIALISMGIDVVTAVMNFWQDIFG